MLARLIASRNPVSDASAVIATVGLAVALLSEPIPLVRR